MAGAPATMEGVISESSKASPSRAPNPAITLIAGEFSKAKPSASEFASCEASLSSTQLRLQDHGDVQTVTPVAFEKKTSQPVQHQIQDHPDWHLLSGRTIAP